MKLTQKPNVKRNAGMTLIELTVVILVLLALIAVLFVGARAYMKASDKTACVMNQRNIQQACRAFFNLNPTASAVALTDIITQDAGEEKFMGAAPTCPTDRTAAYVLAETARDTPVGTLFTSCPNTEDTHTPDETGNW